MSNNGRYEANLPAFPGNGLEDSTEIHESAGASELLQIADEVADESVEAAQFLRELGEKLTLQRNVRLTLQQTSSHTCHLVTDIWTPKGSLFE